MDETARDEARIVATGNVLIALSDARDSDLIEGFCGAVLTVADGSAPAIDLSGKSVYLCGDIGETRSFARQLAAAAQVRVIRELSHGFDEDGAWPIVGVGRVPILVHDVGVYYRRFFEPEIDYFNRIREEHEFQSLTESTKPGTAHRTGIYLTPVERVGEALRFRLLRCSTNLSGPTDNFRAHDRHIVDALNHEASHIFADAAPLNHVLAQIYHNTPATAGHKQTKAKIKPHADKTKDMPTNGVMAFCTFYDQLNKLQRLGDFDYGRNGVSAMTRLVFHRKPPVADEPGGALPAQFTVTLYPNSVFFMPLATNRLYTHEIRSSMLDAERLPTRLGYVVRCSSTEAVHERGQTYIVRGEQRTKLEPPTPEGMAELRRLYAKENATDEPVEYGDELSFSMNAGDYAAPGYAIADEFRRYDLSAAGNLFDELRAGVRFEDQGRGRRGAVLLAPDEARGVPIVRTTSRYAAPAQRFGPVHQRLARRIRALASLPLELNNALIEIYTNAYATMGAHSDQALDLEDDSYIAIFSCYKYPERARPPRMLVIESKERAGEAVELPLTHHGVVVFSLATNRRFRHKIVLDRSARPADNEWLGLTFRTSRTFVRFVDGRPRLDTGAPLTLADAEQRAEFFALRGRENREPDFRYPPLTYTISESDTLPPVD